MNDLSICGKVEQMDDIYNGDGHLPLRKLEAISDKRLEDKKC